MSDRSLKHWSVFLQTCDTPKRFIGRKKLASLTLHFFWCVCVCVHVNNRLSRTQTAAPDISWTERIVSRRLALQLRLGVPRRLPLPPHRTQIGFHIPFHGLPSTAVISCGTWLVYQGRSFLFLLFPPFFLNTFNPTNPIYYSNVLAPFNSAFDALGLWSFPRLAHSSTGLLASTWSNSLSL